MSFMQEAMRGYAFMNDLDRQKQSDAMAQEQFKMQKDRFAREGEQFDMDKRRFEQTTQLGEAQLKGANLTNTATQQKLDQSNLGFSHARMQANGITPKLLKELDDNQLVDVRSLILPEYQENFKIADSVFQGKINRNDPRALGAFNQVLGKQIKRNVGQKGKGGKIISDINIVAMHPSEDGRHMVFESEVTLEDGSKYRAPITENRGTEEDGDNFVRLVPVDGIVNHLIAQRQLRHYIDQEGLTDQVSALYAESLRASKGKGHKPPDRQYQQAQLAQKIYAAETKNLMPGEKPSITWDQANARAGQLLGMSSGNLQAPPQQSNGQAAMKYALEAESKMGNYWPNFTGLDKKSPQEMAKVIKDLAFKNGEEISDADALRAATIQIGDNVKTEGEASPGVFDFFDNMKKNASSQNGNLTGSSNQSDSAFDADDFLNSLGID